MMTNSDFCALAEEVQDNEKALRVVENIADKIAFLSTFTESDKLHKFKESHAIVMAAIPIIKSVMNVSANKYQAERERRDKEDKAIRIKDLEAEIKYKTQLLEAALKNK